MINMKLRGKTLLVLLLVAVGLVAFLGDFFSIDRSGRADGNWAARVNGSEISIRDFRNTARNIDDYYRNLFGNNYGELRDSLQIGQQDLWRALAHAAAEHVAVVGAVAEPAGADAAAPPGDNRASSQRSS